MGQGEHTLACLAALGLHFHACEARDLASQADGRGIARGAMGGAFPRVTVVRGRLLAGLRVTAGDVLPRRTTGPQWPLCFLSEAIDGLDGGLVGGAGPAALLSPQGPVG